MINFRTYMLLSAACVLTISSAALAETAGAGGTTTPPAAKEELKKDVSPQVGPNGMADARASRREKMFMKADKNGDGFLTKEEMLESHKERIDEMFANMDSNKDNKLSKEEMAKGREAMRAKMKDRWQNRDGQKGSPSPEAKDAGKTGAQ